MKTALYKPIFNSALIFCLLFVPQYALAQHDSLIVKVNKTLFQRGETITIDCEMPFASQMHMQASTLNVWIEDLNKYKQWRFRYPLINGKLSFDVVVDTSILDGKYALNFLVEDKLFSMNGKVSDLVKRHDKITYLIMAKNAGNVIDQINVAADGSFLMKNLIFEDTARFIFSPDGGAKSNADNDLNIFIETPLDSAFRPVFTTTKFIVIGSSSMTSTATNGPVNSFKDYKFATENFIEDKNTLKEVVIKGKRKTPVQEFADKYVTGLFSGGDARIFDGIDGTEIASSTSIFTFLQGKVAGLQVVNNNQGSYDLTWRGSNTDLYLDEFRVTNSNDVYISPSDVAMIKVFPPPAFLGGGGSGSGGAIAIYTKRGSYAKESKHKYNFLVRGYNALETKWK